MPNTDELVTVFEPMSLTEAHLCRARLEDAGIQVLEAPTDNAFIALYYGDITKPHSLLQVYTQDAERARELVADFRREIASAVPSGEAQLDDENGSRPGERRQIVGRWMARVFLVLLLTPALVGLVRWIISSHR